MKTRIKKLRTTLQLTQKQFAERLGMKQNTIAGYERGRAAPSKATVRNICREFGVNEEWLREGTGEMYARNPSLDLAALKALFPNLSPETLALVQSIAKLSPEHQKLLAQFITEGAANIQQAWSEDAMRELAKQLEKEETRAVG